jgi:hypothetical protein
VLPARATSGGARKVCCSTERATFILRGRVALSIPATASTRFPQKELGLHSASHTSRLPPHLMRTPPTATPVVALPEQLAIITEPSGLAGAYRAAREVAEVGLRALPRQRRCWTDGSPNLRVRESGVCPTGSGGACGREHVARPTRGRPLPRRLHGEGVSASWGCAWRSRCEGSEACTPTPPRWPPMQELLYLKNAVGNEVTSERGHQS